MTRRAMRISRTDRAVLSLVAAAALAMPAAARDRDEPVVGRTPDAADVVMTPVTDLNLKKDEIPAVLLSAAADPYSSAGIRKCADVSAALAPLNAALGPDMDVATGDPDRLSTGSVAKSVVASFIPFRSILREVTGAAEHQRNFEAAIYAGAVRRGFLKGLGQQMKCPYPARPAFVKTALDPRAEPVALAAGTEGPAAGNKR